MKYFLDTEFIEDGRTIDLISIALVAEDGRYLYACSHEAELHRASLWVRENVFPHLPMLGSEAWMSRADIARKIVAFIGDGGEKPEFYAYFGDYDWVVFCQLFGRMVDLPKGYPMFCFDLKQMMAERGLGKEDVPARTDGTEHNALADARWNLAVYRFLEQVPPQEWFLEQVPPRERSPLACAPVHAYWLGSTNVGKAHCFSIAEGLSESLCGHTYDLHDRGRPWTHLNPTTKTDWPHCKTCETRLRASRSMRSK